MEHPVKSLVNRIWSLTQVEKPQFKDETAAMEQAVAVMLVNAARVDGSIAEAQKTMVLELLKEKFGLSESGAIRLFNAAGLRLRKPVNLYKLANKAIEKMEIEDRLQLMAMVRRVVLADGALDPEEARLLNEMGRMLHINVRDVTQVRARVRDMLGRPIEPYVDAREALRQRSEADRAQIEAKQVKRATRAEQIQMARAAAAEAAAKDQALTERFGPRPAAGGVSINGHPIMANRPTNGGAVDLAM